VTTGTKGSLPTATMSPNSTNYRSWNGVNGKYETVGGRTRSKWNNYSVLACTTSVSSHQWEMLVQYPSPPYAPNPPTVEYDGLSWAPAQTLFDTASAVTDDQKGKVLNKLLGKIKGHQFNLGVEIGQLNQTTGLLTSTLGKLGRSALALRRGDFSTAARQLGATPRTTRLKGRDISGRWLELQYGWLPLISSSYEAMLAYKAVTEDPRKKIFTATSVQTRDIEISQAPSIGTGKVKAKVGRRLQYEMYEELSVQRQLGLLDPLSIAWELTPWSFVIDWFFPFGNYLSNLNQIPKLKGRWLITDFVKYDKTAVEFRYVPAKFQGTRNILAIYRSPRASISNCHSIRTYSANPPPVPLPSFSLNGINSVKRLFNAIALAHNRFLR
jgi:hypothetical protein